MYVSLEEEDAHIVRRVLGALITELGVDWLAMAPPTLADAINCRQNFDWNCVVFNTSDITMG